jgi:hypothetical protein
VWMVVSLVPYSERTWKMFFLTKQLQKKCQAVNVNSIFVFLICLINCTLVADLFITS